MTCYFRHLRDVFRRAGIEVTISNRRDVDHMIHRLVGVNYKDCPAVWRAVKARIVEDEDALVHQLRCAARDV
jgi:hypothetical protein